MKEIITVLQRNDLITSYKPKCLQSQTQGADCTLPINI